MFLESKIDYSSKKERLNKSTILKMIQIRYFCINS